MRHTIRPHGLPFISQLLAVVAALCLSVLLPLVVPHTATEADALDNGLARTPPMGWNDWNAFGCDVSAKLVEQTADTLVSTGLRDAGYTYVNIDDCWMTGSRDSAGDLVADPAKFPGGIKAVADYVHAKGLKFGIYEDAGTSTCGGFPGSYGHEAQDARLFASWGVDYLKYDWCNVPFGDFPGKSHQQVAITLNTRMRDGLKASGRPIVFAMCNGWDTAVAPQTWGAPVGNSWRTFRDIADNWGRINDIFDATVAMAADAGPGGWNDPDMLEVGNGKLSDTEYRSHFSLWAMLAGPLLSGTDLRSASAATLKIYGNRAIIAVDQDSLGKPGVRISDDGTREVITKQLANGDRAVALFNSGTTTTTISTTAAAAGAPASGGYSLTDLWSNAVTGSTGTISASVPAHGTVVYRVHATSVPAGTALVGKASGRCLQGGTSGTRVTIQDCDGRAEQRWTTGSDGSLVGSGGTCLDASGRGTANGTPVLAYTCGGATNQQWTVHPDGTITGVASGLCLDVDRTTGGGGSGNGALAELWQCNGGTNQIWSWR